MTSQLWDEHAAHGYDESTAAMPTEAAVDFLAPLATNGRALEFAIGTGRVAVPLSERGIEVAGIDRSTAMLSHLRAKPQSTRLHIVEGDMSTDVVDGDFSLVYLVYNGITNLLTQPAQVDCFRNAARHLIPGGRFVIECYVPDLRLLPIGAVAVPFAVEDEYVGFDTYDLLTQRQSSHHFTVTEGKSRVFHSQHRYLWPSEMDLMAQLAGLTPTERWSDWSRAPFTADSRAHISIWQKPETP